MIGQHETPPISRWSGHRPTSTRLLRFRPGAIAVLQIQSRKQAAWIFLIAHGLLWLIASFIIHQNEVSLHNRLGVPLMGAGHLITRVLLLPFAPFFYPGADAITSITFGVYGLVIASIVLPHRKRLFVVGFGLWSFYAFGLLMILSAGMRS